MASKSYFQQLDGTATWHVSGGAPGSIAHPEHRDVPASFRFSEKHPLSIDADSDPDVDGDGPSNVESVLRVLLSGRGKRLRSGEFEVIPAIEFASSTERALVSYDERPAGNTKASPRQWDATKGLVRVAIDGDVVTVTLEGVVLEPRTYPPPPNNAADGEISMSGSLVARSYVAPQR